MSAGGASGSGHGVRAAATVAGLISCAVAALAVLEGVAVLAALAALGAGAAGLTILLDLRATRAARLCEADARREIESLRSELRRDQLTGHLNRSAFTAALGELARSDSRSTLVSLFYFDLNRFKEVNDTLGHEIGDMLLQEVGTRAAAVLDDRIALARLGGDEFAAITPYRDESAARALAQGLVDAIGRTFVLGDRCVEVTASVGVAIGDVAVHGADELLRRADAAMYEVKGLGRGGYHVFDDLLSNRQMRESSIRKQLAKARFEERFELHYQPIVNARSGAIEKVEALLRSRDHAMTGIPPSLMVSVAEDSGQIVELTDWTLDCAIKAALKG